MKMTEQERRQSVPPQEVSATRHIDDVSDDELDDMTYAAIAKLGGAPVAPETIASRCRSGMARREAATRGRTLKGKSQFTKDCEAKGYLPTTIRRRMETEGMTFEEATSTPIRTREECGRAAAKSRWGGKK